MAAKPPSGKPTKETIQRATVRAVERWVAGRGGAAVVDVMSLLSLVDRVVGSVALAGDPGRQQVVGVVGEVVADEAVEQVGVPREVGVGEGDELPVAGGVGRSARADEVGRGRPTAGRRRPGARPRRADVAPRSSTSSGAAGVAADRAGGVGLVVGESGLAGHGIRVPRDADGTLTARLTT